MSIVNENKIGTFNILETKRMISGRLLLAISMSSLMVLCISLTLSINTAHAQNTSQSTSNTSSSTTTGTADKSGTIASVQNGPDGKPAWKVSGTWDFKALNSN